MGKGKETFKIIINSEFSTEGILQHKDLSSFAVVEDAKLINGSIIKRIINFISFKTLFKEYYEVKIKES